MANFTPTLGEYTELKPFRFWCQKVLPLVYDDTLSYYELLCKVVDYLNKTMEDVDTMHTDVVNLHEAYVQLQGFVNDYFDNLDVQEEINNKLDAMAQDGSLSALISPFIPDIVSAWLNEHITPTSPAIDNTLTVSGAGADAKRTGDAIVGEYDSTKTYIKGDMCRYGGRTYKLLADTFTGEFDASDWMNISIGNNVNNLERNINQTDKWWGWVLPTLNAISGGKWVKQPTGYSFLIPVNNGDKLTGSNSRSVSYYTVLKSLNGDGTGETPDYATGYSGSVQLGLNDPLNITIPSDGKYVWFYGNEPSYSDNKYFPNTLNLNNVDISNSIINSLKVLNIRTNSKMSVSKSPTNEKIHFPQSTVTDGYFVSAGSGNIFANSDYRASDYIPVNGVKIGISRGVAQFAFYDADKTFISGIQVASGAHDYTEYDIPEGAFYVRLTLLGAQYYTLAYLYCVFWDGYSNPFGDEWIVVDANHTSKVPEFTTLRNAIEFAMMFNNSKVLIRGGTYNLLTEFASEISAHTATQYGLGIGKGIHILGESGTVISCLYSGSDATVYENLSPFYAEKYNGGYTLENIEIRSSNCRYCVHDEYGQFDGWYKNIYKNCKFYHDDTGAGDYSGYYPQCIGGGLGQHGYVSIENCYAKTKRGETYNTPAISYHNTGASTGKSMVNIVDSFIDDYANITFYHYGTSTEQTICVVNNNSVGSNLVLTHISGHTEPENIQMLNYNNTIRH